MPFKKGTIPWNKGLKAKDDERIKRFVDAGHKACKGNIPWNKGKKTGIVPKTAFKKGHKIHFGKHREESKEKMRLANKGKRYSPRTEFKKGQVPWNKGMVTKSFEPYTTDWTETLKRSIRERDHYICQLCSEPQGDRALSVHHIDYDKKNCNPNNLISLCHKCHLTTNYNREYWTNYFINI